MKVVSGFISANTLSRFVFLGSDKEEWKREMLKMLTEDQIPVKYGGTKVIPFLDGDQ